MNLNLICLVFLSLIMACSNNEEAGFSSETTNGIALVDAEGNPAEGVRVRVFDNFESIDTIGVVVYLDTVLEGASELEWNETFEGPVSLQLDLEGQALFIKDFDAETIPEAIQLSPLITKAWVDTIDVDQLGLGGTWFRSENTGQDTLILKAPEGEYDFYFEQDSKEPISNGQLVYGDENSIYENTLLPQGLLLDDFNTNDLSKPSSQVQWGVGSWELIWNSEQVTLNKNWNNSIGVNITSGSLDDSNLVELSYSLDSVGVRFPLDLQEMEKICFLNSGNSDKLSLVFLNQNKPVSKVLFFVPTPEPESKCFGFDNFADVDQYPLLFDEIKFEMASGAFVTLDDLVIFGYNQESIYQNK